MLTKSEKNLLKDAKKKYKFRKLLTDLNNEEYVVYKKHIDFLEEKIIMPIVYSIWVLMFSINMSFFFFV